MYRPGNVYSAATTIHGTNQLTTYVQAVIELERDNALIRPV
jgi:hypothetical protein